jgi:hypothetical protein
MSPWQVPFDRDGNQLHYDGGWNRDGIVYKDPYEFEDSLELLDWEQGRSRITVKLRSLKDGRKYCCTMGSFMDMLHRGKINQTEESTAIGGEFSFKKAGSSVSLILLSGRK